MSPEVPQEHSQEIEDLEDRKAKTAQLQGNEIEEEQVEPENGVVDSAKPVGIPYSRSWGHRGSNSGYTGRGARR